MKQMIFEALLPDLNPLQSAAKYEAPTVVETLLDHGVCLLTICHVVLWSCAAEYVANSATSQFLVLYATV